MNEKIRNHVVQFCKDQGWELEDEKDLFEAIKEAKRVFKGNEEKSRHWIEYECVVEINGMFIRYFDAFTTGDMSAEEKGYDFDPSTICEMMPIEKTVTTYEPVKE